MMLILAACSIPIGLLLTINGSYLHIFLSADKVTAETVRYGNSYSISTCRSTHFWGSSLWCATVCRASASRSSCWARVRRSLWRVAVCLLLPAALAGGVVSAEAPQAAVYGLCVADPFAWMSADAVLCIPFIKNIMRENYDYLYGSGQKLIER